MPIDDSTCSSKLPVSGSLIDECMEFLCPAFPSLVELDSRLGHAGNQLLVTNAQALDRVHDASDRVVRKDGKVGEDLHAGVASG